MRLKGKAAIITGAGQREGDGVGNGRATAILFAREGAKVRLSIAAWRPWLTWL